MKGGDGRSSVRKIKRVEESRENRLHMRRGGRERGGWEEGGREINVCERCVLRERRSGMQSREALTHGNK